VERTLRTYELMTIFRPELAETEVRSEISNIEKALSDRGAEVEKTDFWGKRRLAYEIMHLHEGYYAVVTFAGEKEAIEPLDRALTLSDNVLRHKFIRLE